MTETEIEWRTLDREKPENFPAAVAAGKRHIAQRDSCQWRLGWLALDTPTVYGDQTIRRLAGELGVSYNTLRRHSWVADTFGPQEVAAYPHLTYSYYEVVTKLCQDDPQEAHRFLQTADDTFAAGDRMTVEEFQSLVDPAAMSSRAIVLPASMIFVDVENGCVKIMVEDAESLNRILALNNTLATSSFKAQE